MVPLMLAAAFATSPDGTRIAYDVTGKGPVVMLLHGGGQTRKVWHEQGYVERIRGASIYPAVQNIILACRALGLGTTITTNHIRCEDEVKAVLGIPEDVQTFAMMPIGYPRGKFGPVTRRPIVEVARVDHWSHFWPG